MMVKTISVITAVFFLGLVVDCKVYSDSESSHHVGVDSCQNNELLLQNPFQAFIGDLKSNSSQLIQNADVKSSNMSNVESGKNNTSNQNSTVHVSCILNKTYSGLPVEIVNSSKLAMLLHVEPNVTNRQIPGSCVIVLFYSISCPFSCLAAPHFNALPRFFPNVKMVAIDAMKYRSINAQFGIVGTPTLMLFHNGRPAAKFNDTSEYGLEVFSNFITKHTGVQPVGKLVVTSGDFAGPVSSVPVKETDYYLLLSWLVIAARILYSFYYSTWGRSLVDATLNAWREAEAQHHHSD